MQVDANDFGGSANNGIGIQPRLPGASAVPGSGNANPTMIIARMARKLDQQNVDTQGRWLVVNPVFLEILKDEDSKLLNQDYGESGGLRNGLVVNNLHGFQVYVSNNLPEIGEQINKTETYRDPDSFADIVRGMHLYGRKILRPEALVNARFCLV